MTYVLTFLVCFSTGAVGECQWKDALIFKNAHECHSAMSGGSIHYRIGEGFIIAQCRAEPPKVEK